MLFSGNCPECNHHFVWHDISQELSCLEAKNSGMFGQCASGVETAEHPHDQECQPCSERNLRKDEDEGYCADGLDELDPPGERVTSSNVTSDITKQASTSTLEVQTGKREAKGKGKKHADVDADADADGQRQEDGGKRKKQRVA